MVSARTLIRVGAKSALWLFVALAATIFLWFAGNRLLDESPDPQRNAFVVSSADRILDNRNAAVGLLGLTAPKGADALEYGAKVKALYSRNALHKELDEMVNSAAALKPTVTSDQVFCWVDAGRFKWKECLPFDQAPTVLQQNK